MNKAIRGLVLAQIVLVIFGAVYYDDSQFMSPSWGSLAIATLLIPIILTIYTIIKLTKKPITAFSHIAFIINLIPTISYFAIWPFIREG